VTPRSALVGLGFLLAACGEFVTPRTTTAPTARQPSTTAAAEPAATTATVLAAGDIASCDSDGDEATAACWTRW
jgi:hypothetical protein